MRLTLRTLLSYLDDELGPTDRNEIGTKLQESPMATALAERIRGVISRSDLAAPAVAGTGMGIDPNSVAQYLENLLPPEQVVEVEKLCLVSDQQLAEVAACHQLLKLGRNAPFDSASTRSARFYALEPEYRGNGGAPAVVSFDDAPIAGAAAAPRATPTEQWHFRLFGVEFGPVPVEAIEQTIESGQLSEDDDVRSDGDEQWIKVKNFLTRGTAGANGNAAVPHANPVNRTDAAPPSEVPADAWFCQSSHIGQGPHTFDALLNHARQGALRPDDQIRLGDQGPWRRAGSLGRLMAEMPYQQAAQANGADSQLQVQEAIDDVLPKMRDVAHTGSGAEELVSSVPLTDAAPTQAQTAAVANRASPANSTADEWYVQLGRLICGPMDLPQVMEWAQSGRIQASDTVKMGRHSAWVAASTIPGLIPKSPANTPTPLPAARPTPAPMPRPVAAATPATPQLTAAPPARPVAAPPVKPQTVAATPAVAAPAPNPPSVSEPPPDNEWTRTPYGSAGHAARGGGSPFKPKPVASTKGRRGGKRDSQGGGFAAVLRSPAFLGVAGVVAAVALVIVGWMMVPESIGKFREPCVELRSIYKQVAEKVAGKPSPADWQMICKKTKADLEPIEKKVDSFKSGHELNSRLINTVLGLKGAASAKKPEDTETWLKQAQRNLEIAEKILKI